MITKFRFYLTVLITAVLSVGLAQAADNSNNNKAPNTDTSVAQQAENLGRQAKMLAAKGKIDDAESLLCPEGRQQPPTVLSKQSQTLIIIARQLVEDEQGLNAILLAERAQQRLEQIENNEPPSQQPIRLVTALQKAYLFDRVLFDKERAYLAYKDVLRLSPANRLAKRRRDDLAKFVDTLRYYGTTTPALNRAYATTSASARLEMEFAPESISIRVHANNSAMHRLETSSDLVTWIPVASGLKSGTSFRHQVQDERECRFYRLWRESFEK